MTENRPLLLALDAGSTHCKAAVFDAAGGCLSLSNQATPVTKSDDGASRINPSALWQVMTGLVRTAASQVNAAEIAAIGITSMAESGLLVERANGAARTPILPWFDLSAAPQANLLRERFDPAARFCVTGIYPSYKCSLAKILYARDQLHASLDGAVWLSAADFLAHRLSGGYWTDPSLAGRTYCFDIERMQWDAAAVEEFELPSDLFPPVWTASQLAGRLTAAAAQALGLGKGIPVVVAGHDHVCAALAAGILRPGQVLDSIGTAESLGGAMAVQPLGQTEQQSGFSIGRHVTGDRYFWQGGLSSAGGALEWLRSLAPGQALDYAQLSALLEQIPDRPGEVLFFPYLAGSGSPHTLPEARAAFIGLRSHHKLAHLALAVLEGTAFEVEFMRRQAEMLIRRPIQTITATGGGVRNALWMQIKADVTGKPHRITPTPEAALLGAALLGGVGTGIFADGETAAAAIRSTAYTAYQPDPQRHAQYNEIFERGFLPLQAPLRTYFHNPVVKEK